MVAPKFLDVVPHSFPIVFLTDVSQHASLGQVWPSLAAVGFYDVTSETRRYFVNYIDLFVTVFTNRDRQSATMFCMPLIQMIRGVMIFISINMCARMSSGFLRFNPYQA
eukprot:TRINITY_DN3722_c0_g2_i1.p1 TRINITY_DN3722_c0_g2~~TRINITY_DN3722_c0_g2_i1.p1  ORF type:complete len:109 (-),score=0.28 TRINITY_DN3722_c0_g2_i1:334-660(-)